MQSARAHAHLRSWTGYLAPVGPSYRDILRIALFASWRIHGMGCSVNSSGLSTAAAAGGGSLKFLILRQTVS